MKTIILSGGMDSAVLLYDRHKEIDLALTFKYGSKHNDREAYFASCLSKAFKIEHVVLDMTDIFKNFKSNLLKSGGSIPEGHYEDESMRSTVVPFRNGIMLSVAVGIAESRGHSAVLLGAHKGDHAIYPDCRESFVYSFSEAVKNGTYNNLVIEAPYVNMTKREIAILGSRLEVDFSTTYSCYNGREKHCGKCGTCVERKEALEGFDTTVYE